jgi:hypothetical protein
MIDLTLSEKSTLTYPYYLFVFKNDATKQSVKFIAINRSTKRYRYDRFYITETSGTNDYLDSTITLSPTGYWHYKIYEQSSLTNLDENLSVGKVEEGKVLVVGTETNRQKHQNTRTYKVYGTGA